MNAIGLKLITNEAKKLANAAIDLTKKILTTCLRIQYNAAVLPAYFVYGGLMYVFQKYFVSDESSPELEPRSDEIVGAARRLRNSVLSSVIAITSSRRNTKAKVAALNKDSDAEQHNEYKDGELLDNPECTTDEGSSTTESSCINQSVASIEVSEFSGGDFLWDVPIMYAKGKYLAQCVNEKKESETMAARKALEEHPVTSPMPSTRQEYNSMKRNARNLKEHSVSVIKFSYAEPRNADDYEANNETDYTDTLEPKQKVNFSLDSESSQPSQRQRTKYSCKKLSLPQDKVVCREISATNRTLRKVQVTCSRLLGQLSNLNETLSKIISMKEKIVSLEFQIDEGNRLLQEVESDRFLMKSKLSILEKLINEEEKFLYGDVTCESGFYESIGTPVEF